MTQVRDGAAGARRPRRGSGWTRTGPGTSSEAAERLLAAIERHEIELAEQPVGTLEQMAELAARARIPLAADESVASPIDARARA